MELTIFWLMVGAFVCRASYIAEKYPTWRAYDDLINAWIRSDTRDIIIGVLTIGVLVMLWPLTLYYFWMDKGDW